MKFKKCKVCGKEFEEEKGIGYCNECPNERQGKKYIVEINPPRDEDEYALISFRKNYGNYCGGGRGVKSRDKLIQIFKKIKERWESYDHIVEREGDKVTEDNLYFYSFTDDITKMELLGVPKLKNWT